jgi:hypothetical protein
MNNFEPKSKEEVQQLFGSLRSKSVGEIISLYGTPARQLGEFHRERIHWDGKVEVVEYRRVLGFLGRGSTEHILWVYERSNRELELGVTESAGQFWRSQCWSH